MNAAKTIRCLLTKLKHTISKCTSKFGCLFSSWLNNDSDLSQPTDQLYIIKIDKRVTISCYKKMLYLSASAFCRVRFVLVLWVLEEEEEKWTRMFNHHRKSYDRVEREKTKADVLKTERQIERKSSVESSRCKGEWNWNEKF